MTAAANRPFTERYRARCVSTTCHRADMQAAEEPPRATPSLVSSRPRYVLCYGHDAVLLKSRRRILELAGCPAEIAIDDIEFRELMCSGCPGVIVLCQTLLPEEGAHAASLALEFCPTMPLLVLYNQQRKFIPAQKHHFFQSAGGPRIFADVVFNLLYNSQEDPRANRLDSSWSSQVSATAHSAAGTQAS